MIKVIFFDAAGILYRRSMPTERYALNLLAQRGFRTEINAEQQESLRVMHAQANRGAISHESYWDQFLLFRGVEQPEQRQELYQNIVSFSNDVDPVPGAKEALQQLKKKGMVLGVITDTMYPLEWKMRRLEKAGVADLLDVMACSTDLGVRKPDPKVYQYAVHKTPYAPSQCAFVGHLGIELQGARAAGMTTIAIDQDPEATADYYCTSLLALPALSVFDDRVPTRS